MENEIVIKYLWHMLGLEKPKRKNQEPNCYRNYYCSNLNIEPALQQLLDDGYIYENNSQEAIESNYRWFYCTEEGKAAALKLWEDYKKNKMNTFTEPRDGNTVETNNETRFFEDFYTKPEKSNDYYEVIENCGAPFKIQHTAMSLIEEWKVDNCEVAIIAAKPDEIILEATDEHENKLQVKVCIENGNTRLFVKGE